jgi:hypothetical protein
MELKDYSTEELKAELKRRVELSKAQKAEEMKTAKRCRNCKHCEPNSNWGRTYICMARTWGKEYPRHYVVSLSKPACELFERKTY